MNVCVKALSLRIDACYTNKLSAIKINLFKKKQKLPRTCLMSWDFSVNSAAVQRREATRAENSSHRAVSLVPFSWA